LSQEPPAASAIGTPTKAITASSTQDMQAMLAKLAANNVEVRAV
jgi:hypothetical protein